jgi:hypothetical protein
LAFVTITLSVVSYLILSISKKPGGIQKLFSKQDIYARRWGALFDTLNEKKLPFAVVSWVKVLGSSAIIAFGQGNGFAQMIAMCGLQLFVCISEHSL